jgi:hypothetical protein
LRYDQISDGLAYTLFFGDKRTDPKGRDLGWMSGTRATLRNTGIPLNTTVVKAVAGPPVSDMASPDGSISSLAAESSAVAQKAAAKKPTVGGFGSEHPVVVQFALGDGSVRGIVESIDMQTFQRLGNRADGQLVEFNF